MTPDGGERGAGDVRATDPKIWLLMGHRAGDNAQLLALAEALGWPYEAKWLDYRRSELVTNLLFDATLIGRVRARSSPIGPPWPSLVLSAGRRSEPIARWIRRHADPPPKLVHVGRPWRDVRAFDFVLVTPQYRVQPQAGVLQNALPLHRVTGARLAEAAAEWGPRLAHLPRPWIGVLVGGSSELFTLDARNAARLAHDASALARTTGGSLLVTTSARTSPRACAALRRAIDVPAEIFTWTAAAPENPYWGYLALADALVVTGDSVSMLAEACATGKPVHIFDPGRAPRDSSADWMAAVRRLVFNLGIPRLGRDVRRVHAELVRRGHATFLGEPFAGAAPPPPDQLAQAVARVRALVAEADAPPLVPPQAELPARRIWAILCDRTGDNAQTLALAEALGSPFEVKRLAFRRLGRFIDVWRGTTLLGIRKRRSSPLTPPWPDLVISASMRNEPVCRWIRKQSGGKTRYVHIGKPWARLATFDLVITVPEYRWVPKRPNVLHNAFSLHGVSEARLAQEGRAWAPALADLPRPFVAVLVGGYAGPYALDREHAERLGREASALAGKHGGSLLVTTSARTSRAAIDGLSATIDVPYHLFRWSPHADRNPYFGFLALADSIIVTCDSTSMLAEACATGKPVHMFDLGVDRAAGCIQSSAQVGRWGRARRWWRRCNADRLRAFAYRHFMLRFAPRNLARDITAVHDAVLSSGRAVWLGEPFPAGTPTPLDEMPRTLERVRTLFRDPAEQPPASTSRETALGIRRRRWRADRTPLSRSGAVDEGAAASVRPLRSRATRSRPTEPPHPRPQP